MIMIGTISNKNKCGHEHNRNHNRNLSLHSVLMVFIMITNMITNMIMNMIGIRIGNLYRIIVVISMMLMMPVRGMTMATITVMLVHMINFLIVWDHFVLQ